MELPCLPCQSVEVRRPNIRNADRQPWSAEIHLRFPIAHEFYGWLVIAARISGAARRVVSTGLAFCGWLRGTSRTSPGPPRRWRRPVRLRGTSARGRGFAAYLSACGGQPFNVRCAHYAKGLRSLPFLVTCQWQVIPSHSFAALTALVVRRVRGITALFVRRVNGIAALLMCRINGYLA